jgi:Tol biopolymer transport system component
MLRASFASVSLVLIFLSSPAVAGPLTLLSKADPDRPSGTAGGASEPAGVSADGRYTVFLTDAANLLPGVTDLNAGKDVFFHDRVTGTTVLVSHPVGDPFSTGDGPSDQAVLSADGRWVGFRSYATNLAAGQVDSPGNSPDMFLWERDTGTVTLVSHQAGQPTTATGQSFFAPDLSADGGRMVYISLATNLVAGQAESGLLTLVDAFLYDRATGTNFLVSHRRESVLNAAGSAAEPVISADGKWVAFVCTSDDVVDGQDDAHLASVFLYEKATGVNRMVSHAAADPAHSPDNGSYDPRISANGGRVAYVSLATNLVSGQSDPNGAFDVFLYDRVNGTNRLVSHARGSSTTVGNQTSFFSQSTLNSNGRYVAFSSAADDLVANDFNQRPDVFLYDFSSGRNTLVSRSASGLNGQPGDGFSDEPRISSDGAWVAFQSASTDLVPGQTETNTLSDDVFLWSRDSGAMILVTHADGSPAEASNGETAGFRISSDGAWIALASTADNLSAGVDDANAAPDLFLYARTTAGNALLTGLLTVRGGAPSAAASGRNPQGADTLSDDGRYAAFLSAAPNLIPGQEDGNNATDVFLHDRLAGTTTLVSHTSGSAMPAGTAGNALSRDALVSPDGSAVVFLSDASDLVPGLLSSPPGTRLFLQDTATGQTTLVDHAASSPGTPPIPGNGAAGPFSVSADGRWVAFVDSGSNLVAGQVDTNFVADVFLYDYATGGIVLISHNAASPNRTANASSNFPVLSGDGRYVAFTSQASDLVPGQSGAGGLFVYDRIAGTTVRASPSVDFQLAISRDGRWVAFRSTATNLVPGQVDANGTDDVFLWDRISGSTILVSHASGSFTAAGNGRSDLNLIPFTPPVISADGRWVAFLSDASDLVAGQSDSNFGPDVFLFDRISGTLTLVSRSAASSTTAGDWSSYEPALSADGRFVSFFSPATDLVPGQADANGGGGYDFFLYDRATGTTTLLSHVPSSETITGAPGAYNLLLGPRISADGAWTVFWSPAPDLAPEDLDGLEDVFLHANPVPGQDFFTLPPCRLLDTRQQGPILATGVERTVLVAGSCGVPATARAVAVNVTVVQPTAEGSLTLYPGDLAAPLAATISFPAGSTRAGSAILGLALDGAGTLSILPAVNGGGTVHVLLDVSGYFE